MRALIPAAVVFTLLAAGCRPAPVPPPPPDPDSIGQALKLVIDDPNGTTFRPGTTPALSLTLVNTSPRATFRVVNPIPLERSGGRLHVSFLVLYTRPAPGSYPCIGGRCGTFRTDLTKAAVVELKPGGRLPFGRCEVDVTLPSAGRVGVVARYVYTPDPQRPWSEAMAGVPAFELESNPVEFDIGP